MAKGYRGAKHRQYRRAKEAVLHAGQYAFAGRRQRRRDFRTLWITRIAGAAKKEGMSYSVLMNKLKKSKIDLDRKILNDLIVNDPDTFKKVVDEVRSA